MSEKGGMYTAVRMRKAAAWVLSLILCLCLYPRAHACTCRSSCKGVPVFCFETKGMAVHA